MNTFKHYTLALVLVVLTCLSSAAQAEQISGTVDYYQANSTNDNCGVLIGGIKLNAAKGAAGLLRDAFFRQLIVTVTYTPTISVPYIGPTGSVSVVTIQSVDLP